MTHKQTQITGALHLLLVGNCQLASCGLLASKRDTDQEFKLVKVLHASNM